MAGLQRSEETFRRQGSSGMVWDDKVLSGELKKLSTKADDHDKRNSEPRESKPSNIQRNRSNGGRAYRAANVTPSADPPSPKVSGCGICGAFGKLNKSQQQRKSGGRRRS